ncbi:hypothetical protein [Candidatus Chrysopegis kryptomonas]|uniref:Uncharacterized protein n=1 Tax=Candidatus Chryseopegocella kryptomonas TaxID=1633643 RepID=A0A0P1NYH5_9BACT|nr:hypothetical protein [Candidatus Chrysopegis kryptomonas]CUT04185.1 hypothetical protein JGI23_01660 [Candidatus Chrysopegis kryptomonas]
MIVKGQAKRIKPIYLEEIKIPKKFKIYFWDCPNSKTYLEKFILRILQYGSFEEIKWLYKKFSSQTYYVAFTYPEIKRGVKFWIKLWKEKGLKE